MVTPVTTRGTTRAAPALNLGDWQQFFASCSYLELKLLRFVPGFASKSSSFSWSCSWSRRGARAELGAHEREFFYPEKKKIREFLLFDLAVCAPQGEVGPAPHPQISAESRGSDKRAL